MTDDSPGDFTGAKVAILSGDSLVTLHRDDDPAIAYPGLWDLPGGGREGTESAAETVVRETFEETGLVLAPYRLVYRRDYVSNGVRVVFFAAVWPGLRETDMRLGDEGQALRLMPVAEFVSRADAIPRLQGRVRDVLACHSAASDPVSRRP